MGLLHAVLALDINPYEFACDSAAFGIPQFWNVVTNLPLFFVGLRGLRHLQRAGRLGERAYFNWAGLWVSTALVCVGSILYHWRLDPLGLALDRVAICGVIAFLTAHVLDVARGVGPSRRFSLALLLLCEATVLAWVLGASAWFYGSLQAGGGLFALALLLDARRKGVLRSPIGPLLLFTGSYGVAKLLELFDARVCEWTGFIGGHPLKHLASALGLWFLGAMMRAELGNGHTRT